MLYASELRPIIANRITDAKALLISYHGKSKTFAGLNVFKVYTVADYGYPVNISDLLSQLFGGEYTPGTCNMEGSLEVARANLLTVLRDCGVDVEEESISVYALD